VNIIEKVLCKEESKEVMTGRTTSTDNFNRGDNSLGGQTTNDDESATYVDGLDTILEEAAKDQADYDEDRDDEDGLEDEEE
jgi:hypothetical protein